MTATRPKIELTGATQRSKTQWCVIRLDRFQFLVPGVGRKSKLTAPPRIIGFATRWDRFVRSQTTTQTYRRVRELWNGKTGTRIFIQYQPAKRWLSTMRVTVIGDDLTGIRWSEIDVIMRAFHDDSRLNLVEFAFDFSPDSGVDLSFVRRHARFGKSRPRQNGSHPGVLWYGTRHSAKFVRCYHKQSVAAYRVELELHGSWGAMRSESPSDIRHIQIGPQDLCFVAFEWARFAAYLAKKKLPVREFVRKAKAARASLHDFLRYLKYTLGINNPHRFLREMKINGDVRRAVAKFRNCFRRDKEQHDSGSQ